jgi:hypothetical protein
LADTAEAKVAEIAMNFNKDILVSVSQKVQSVWKGRGIWPRFKGIKVGEYLRKAKQLSSFFI